jgi:hypothetical protein
MSKFVNQGSSSKYPPTTRCMSSTELASAVDQAQKVYLHYRDSPLSHVPVLQHNFRTAEQLFPILEQSNNEVSKFFVQI